jgi:hypothetical protein
MKVDEHKNLIGKGKLLLSFNLELLAIDTADPGLQDKIYNHKFRERNARKDVSP